MSGAKELDTEEDAAKTALIPATDKEAGNTLIPILEADTNSLDNVGNKEDDTLDKDNVAKESSPTLKDPLEPLDKANIEVGSENKLDGGTDDTIAALDANGAKELGIEEDAAKIALIPAIDK